MSRSRDAILLGEVMADVMAGRTDDAHRDLRVWTTDEVVALRTGCRWLMQVCTEVLAER